MNINEAKQKLHDLAFAKMNCKPDDLKLADVMQILNQIDTQPKVVVPRVVADWIEECKNRNIVLMDALSLNDDVNDWLDVDDNEDQFARAWLDGYEVEKEQLYVVEIPNPNENISVYLYRTTNGCIAINTIYNNPNWKEFPQAKLTKSEIKQDFEWAWQFAKPVD